MADSEIDYLLVGHITADIVPGGRILGGTVSYAARVAHSFGLRVGILTSMVPDDPLLDELWQYAADIKVLPADETTTYENVYNGFDRTQYVRGVAAPINSSDLPERWRSVPLIHIAPIAGEIANEIVQPLDSHSAVMVTPQGWMRRWDEDGRVHFRRWFDENVLRRADFVVFSEEDVAESPGLAEEIIDVASDVFVTDGASGGTYYHQDGSTEWDVFPVEAEDPTGAGDVFATSLFAAWHELDHDIEAATRVATILAARSITRVGLDGAPKPDEIRFAFEQVGHDRQDSVRR